MEFPIPNIMLSWIKIKLLKTLLNDLAEIRLGMKINMQYDKIYCETREVF